MNAIRFGAIFGVLVSAILFAWNGNPVIAIAIGLFALLMLLWQTRYKTDEGVHSSDDWSEDHPEPDNSALAGSGEEAGYEVESDERAKIDGLLAHLELPALLESHRTYITNLVAEQIEDGFMKLRDPYWTDAFSPTQNNVGMNILEASLAALTSLHQFSVSDESGDCYDADEVLNRLARYLEKGLNDYEIVCADPDGYGASTYRTTIRSIDNLLCADRTGEQRERRSTGSSLDLGQIFAAAERSNAEARKIARERIPGFSSDVPGIAANSTRNTIAALKRFFANELSLAASENVENTSAKAWLAALSYGQYAQTFASEKLLAQAIGESVSVSPDIDSVQAQNSYLTAKIGTLISAYPGEDPVAYAETVYHLAEEVIKHPVYRLRWAEKATMPDNFCPVSLYCRTLAHTTEPSLTQIIRAYRLLYARRDGINLSCEEISSFIEQSDDQTLHIEYFIVLNEGARFVDGGESRESYICMSFIGGDIGTLRLHLCLTDKAENDREIGDWRGNLTGFGEAEMRVSEIDPVIKVAFFEEPTSPDDVEDFVAAAKAITVSRSLVGLPINKKAGSYRKILVRPIGDISRVPFEALRCNDDPGTFLGDVFPVRYMQKPLILSPFVSGSPIDPEDSIVLGCNDFDETDATIRRPNDQLMLPSLRSLFEPLDGVVEECRAVSEILGCDPSATSSKTDLLERFSQGAPIIHLATHAFSIDQQFLSGNDGSAAMLPWQAQVCYAGIVLSGANAGMDEEGQVLVYRDRIIESAELEASRLDQTQLMVLSACQSALGVVELDGSGEGLREAILRSGVSCVISSLWEVKDNSTALFMRRFYASFVEGRSASEALWHARKLSKDDIGTDRFAFVALGNDVVCKEHTQHGN